MDRGITKMISFFFKDKGSGHIRGYQIGKYLNMRLNPVDNYENDICIYVKMRPPENYPKNTFLDIVDAEERMPWLRKHPDVKVIASSICAYNYLKKELQNEIIYIPQHHCNYERRRTVNFNHQRGVVGGKGAIEDGVEKMFPGFIWIKNFKSRKDVVDGYKNIDVQIIWRKNNKPLKNPLKIINAMSFGIPTIAYPEICNQEVDNYYFKAEVMEDLMRYITFDSDELIKKSEEYHIDNISKLYLNLNGRSYGN